jgi:hypothetical protein
LAFTNQYIYILELSFKLILIANIIRNGGNPSLMQVEENIAKAINSYYFNAISLDFYVFKFIEFLE